jgi:hypothetical protein
MPDEAQEVREFLRQRVEEVQRLSWEDLDRYGKRAEAFTTSAGNTYRVVTKAYWDGDEWESGIEIEGHAYAPSGWRRWLPYSDHRVRGAETDPVGEPPPGWMPSRAQRRRRQRREKRQRERG